MEQTQQTIQMNGSKIKRTLKRIGNHWQLYVFLIIPIIYIIIFHYIPMGGIQIAFRKFNARDGIWGSKWIGFDNFIRFFGSYEFKRVISNTVILSGYSLIANFPLPILLALILNSVTSTGHKKFAQTVTYLPYFISTVVLVSILIQILNPRVGLLANIYRMFTDKSFPDLMGMPKAFRHLYVWSGVWQSMGYNSIVYMAALSGVDQELHEAAQIDGASRFKRVLHIDFPTVLPTASILLIMNAGRIMNVGFEKVNLMQNNLNIATSQVISTYVYKVGLAISPTDFSYATAIDLFNSIINLVLILLVNKISKKISDNSLF